jgi:hypothetical protein
MIKFVTIGGKTGTHNVYFDNGTCKINTDMDVSGYEVLTWETVKAAYEAEHPEEEETDDYI